MSVAVAPAAVGEERASRPEMPAFTLGARMTDEQRAFLDRHGFIRFRRFAPPDLVRALAAEVEEIDRRLVAEGRTIVNGVPLIVGRRADGTRYVQRMAFASTFGPKLHDFLQDPRFRAILEVAGPDYRIGERERDGLVVNHFRHEEGSAYARLGWHTDSLRDLFYFERPRRYLNVGFYLDDSPTAKGGVRVLPGSHEQSLRSMLFRKRYFVDHAPDPDEVAIEAEAGDLTIHDGRLWHRVAQATATGDASQRRVMYLPLMNGPVKLKDESSPTPFYFRLRKLAGYG
ncbi:MAG TPA: phytanoyl-CoA dioxygenase family protein [Candidatus Binatia bacterium]|nr:phytanoyl-CoA dioxygenase family protein [Candidatus Binatia bacterium]